MKLRTVAISGFRSIENLSPITIGRPTLVTGQNDGGKTTFLTGVLYLLGKYQVDNRDHTYLDVSDLPETQEPLIVAEGQADERERCELLVVEGTFGLNDQEQERHQLPDQIRLRRVHRLGGPSEYQLQREVTSRVDLRDLDALKVDDLKALCSKYELEPKGTKPVLVEALQAKARTFPMEIAWVTAPALLLRDLPTVLVFDSENATSAEDSIRKTLTATYSGHLHSDDLSGQIRDIEEKLDSLLQKDVDSLLEHIKSRCPDVGVVTIQPNASLDAGVRNANITVEPRPGEEVRLSEAGAGRARRVALAVWEASSQLAAVESDLVLLYDEPDTHLDYQHQRDLMRIVLEQAEAPRTSVIVATHSMNLIDGVDISDVIHFRLDKHRSAVDILNDDLDTGQHLASIAASLGLRNTVLLHERLFVGVEGATETASLPILFRLAMGKHLETCGIALWACGNNEGALTFARFLKDHHRRVAFLIDQDSETNNPRVFSKERLEKQGLDPNEHALYWGAPNELEDLFADETWARIANIAWRRTDQRRWVASDFAQHRTGKFSSKVLDMLKSESLTGPASKPAVMSTLAGHLSVAELPADVVDRFEKLCDRAA